MTKRWVRTCQVCDYTLNSSTEPSDKTKASNSYGFRKCPKCKSEAFDYGTWFGYDSQPWRDKWKALTGRELDMPEGELEWLLDEKGGEGLFEGNELYKALIKLNY
jgi:hypothetical protein